MCSFLSKSGKHLVLLAISGIDDVMTLFTSVEGSVNLKVRFGDVCHLIKTSANITTDQK